MSAETLVARIREHCADCRTAWGAFIEDVCEETLRLLAAHEQEQQDAQRCERCDDSGVISDGSTMPPRDSYCPCPACKGGAK